MITFRLNSKTSNLTYNDTSLEVLTQLFDVHGTALMQEWCDLFNHDCSKCECKPVCHDIKKSTQYLTDICYKKGII